MSHALPAAGALLGRHHVANVLPLDKMMHHSPSSLISSAPSQYCERLSTTLSLLPSSRPPLQGSTQVKVLQHTPHIMLLVELSRGEKSFREMRCGPLRLYLCGKMLGTTNGTLQLLADLASPGWSTSRHLTKQQVGYCCKPGACRLAKSRRFITHLLSGYLAFC